jgi:magnesium chelatase family protein
VIGVRSLAHLLAVLRGEDTPEVTSRWRPADHDEEDLGLRDLRDVIGQDVGRRAIEVAAAGGHHMLLLGPPGCGKTMLAERLPSILPPLSQEAALEVSAVHSVAGLLTAERPLVARPPFRAPHHSATIAALVGGGSGVLRPGAASLSHHGFSALDLPDSVGRCPLYGDS